MTRKIIKASLENAEDWSDAVEIFGMFNFTMRGVNAYTGKLRLQRSFISPFTSTAVWADIENPDLSSTAADMYDFTPKPLTDKTTSFLINEPEEGGVWYRSGIPTGTATTGKVEIRISQ